MTFHSSLEKLLAGQGSLCRAWDHMEMRLYIGLKLCQSLTSLTSLTLLQSVPGRERSGQRCLGKIGVASKGGPEKTLSREAETDSDSVGLETTPF